MLAGLVPLGERLPAESHANAKSLAEVRSSRILDSLPGKFYGRPALIAHFLSPGHSFAVC